MNKTSFKNLTNEIYGFWKVISLDENKKTKYGGLHWNCECLGCGTRNSVAGGSLKNGNSTNCGCKRKGVNPKTINVQELINKRFNSLTIIGDGGAKILHGHTRSIAICRCDCGKVVEFKAGELRTGKIKSCGCYSHIKGPNGYSKNRKKTLKDSHGYIKIFKPEHPNANKIGYVKEHVFVMSEHLGRKIENQETIHHKNGIRHDNRLENLELWGSSHPAGQRVKDVYEFCLDFINKHKQEYESGKLGEIIYCG